MRSTVPPTEKKVLDAYMLTTQKSFKIGGFNYFGYDNSSFCSTCSEVRPKECIRCPECHRLVRHRAH